MEIKAGVISYLNSEIAHSRDIEQTLSQAVRNLRDAGYAFGGIAATGTNPNPITGNCFYIVRGIGTYTHFRNADDEPIVLSNDGIYVFTYESVENNYWEYNLIIGIDSKQTLKSKKIIESGGTLKFLTPITALINSIKDFVIEGKYYSPAGNIESSPNYSMLDYIDVNGSRYIYYFGITNASCRCFDDNGIIGSSTNDIDNKRLVLVEGTKYVGIYWNNTMYQNYDNAYFIFSSAFKDIFDNLAVLNNPLPSIQKFFKNAISIKDYFYDNHYYYDGSIQGGDTFACTNKIPVSCSFVYTFGFSQRATDKVFCWDSSNTYLGTSDYADENGKFVLLENTAYIAFNLKKDIQPENYVNEGIVYNFEPFTLDKLINAEKANRLISGIIPLDSIFIDNSYYDNNNGNISSADTYARTEKIPVGDKTFCYIFGFTRNTCLCWNNDTYLGQAYWNNEVEKKFVFLENTTHIAFNISKGAQPENYKENGIIFNMLSFVPQFSKEISELRESIGKAGNVLYRKKWVVVGDSFSEWSDEQFTDGIYVNKYKTYKFFIALRNDMIISDYTMSGRTMTYPNDHTFNNAFAKPSLYQNIPADADYITIQLGINDISHVLRESQDAESVDGDITIGTIDSTDTGTFYGAWNTVLQWIFENRPNAHVGIIITNGLGNNGPEGTYTTVGLQIYNALKGIVRKWNVPYIDLNGGDGKTPMMQRGIYPEGTPAALIAAKWNAFATSPTGVFNGHTNAAGHLYESTFIENFLRSL